MPRLQIANVLLWTAVLGLGVALLIAKKAAWLDTDEIATVAQVIGGALAAYFGAAVAMQLQRQREFEEQRTINVAAVNMLLVVLTQRLEALVNYHAQVIAPFRGRPHRHLQMPRTLAALPDTPVQLERLAGLLAAAEAANAVIRVARTDQHFKAVTDRVMMFEADRAKLRDKMDSPDRRSEGLEPADTVRRVAGEALWRSLEGGVEMMDRDVAAAIERHHAAIVEVSALFRRLLGERVLAPAIPPLPEHSDLAGSTGAEPPA